jgi:hypothetical protein
VNPSSTPSTTPSSTPSVAPGSPAGTSASGGRLERQACCGGRVRSAVRVGVPLVLVALILWLLSYSGFQHDFLRVSSNDQYKTDIPLSLCAIALACMLLRMPAVVRRLRCAPQLLLRSRQRPPLTPCAVRQASSLLYVDRS